MDRARLVLDGLRNRVETGLRNKGRLVYDVFSRGVEPVTPLFDPAEDVEILRPERDGDGFWVGAPTPFYDEKSGEVFLYYRVRDADRRGWKGVIARLDDGHELEEIWEVEKEDIPAYSVEGAAIQRDKGLYRLYLSYNDIGTSQWRIDILEADSLEELDCTEARSLEIDTGKFVNVKDPVMYDDDLVVHAASNHWFSKTNFLVERPDGGNPRCRELGIDGRITSILGDKVLYDWAQSIVYTGDESTKIARENSSGFEDITVGREAICSSEGTLSLRYVRAIEVEDEIWFFYEKSMPNNGHKLCLNKVAVDLLD